MEKGEKEGGGEKQAKGKISGTSDSDHIGKMSAPVCWQDKQRQPDLRASLLWLCLEAKPKINNTAALRLWIPTPPTTGPAIPPPTNPGRGRRGRVKINILSSHVS